MTTSQKNHALFAKAKYFTSVVLGSPFPTDTGTEVAFVGRSNVGKSTLINRLCSQRDLARVSKTPGRTQMINYFSLDEERRLVDLPGYGYAKVPKKISETWRALLNEYFETRTCLKGLILVVDIRRGLMSLDSFFLEYLQHSELPTHIVLSKADCFSYGKAKNTRFEVEKELKAWPLDHVTVQIFSALQAIGLEELQEKVAGWLGME